MIHNISQESNEYFKDFLIRNEKGEFRGLNAKLTEIIVEDCLEKIVQNYIYVSDSVGLGISWGRIFFDDINHNNIYITSIYNFTLFKLIDPYTIYFEERNGKKKVTIYFSENKLI